MKNPAPKVEIGLGKLLFANVNHDMMYSIDSPYKQKGENCSSTNDNSLDQCVINVIISMTKKLYFRKSTAQFYLLGY